MEITMTVWNGAALFGAIFFLALTPTLSSITVAMRSASFGRAHGAAAAIGVACGDVAYVLIAVLGLTTVASEARGFLELLKFAGAGYLAFLSFQLWQADPSPRSPQASARAGMTSSFLAGFLLTLSDYKAILFYLVFLPAFIDLEAISPPDAALVVAIAAIAVLLAKMVYAVIAERASARLAPSSQRLLKRLAAVVLAIVAASLLLK